MTVIMVQCYGSTTMLQQVLDVCVPGGLVFGFVTKSFLFFCFIICMKCFIASMGHWVYLFGCSVMMYFVDWCLVLFSLMPFCFAFVWVHAL